MFPQKRGNFLLEIRLVYFNIFYYNFVSKKLFIKPTKEAVLKRNSFIKLYNNEISSVLAVPLRGCTLNLKKR